MSDRSPVTMEATGSDDDGAIIDRLFDALSKGDVAAARSCLTSDARIWHSFDQIALDRDAAAAGWDAFVTMFQERTFTEVNRQPIEGGFLQRHIMVTRVGDRRMAWPICIIFRIRDGHVARIDEYMDRAGHFTPPAPPATPGLD